MTKEINFKVNYVFRDGNIVKEGLSHFITTNVDTWREGGRSSYKKLAGEFISVQGELETIESGIKDLKEYLSVYQGLAAVSKK